MTQNTRRQSTQVPKNTPRNVAKNVAKNVPKNDVKGAVKADADNDANANVHNDAAVAPTKKSFTLSVGFSAVMSGLLVLVGCSVVAFMLGVIVGRGQEDIVEHRGMTLPLTTINNSEKPTSSEGETSHATSSKEKATGNKNIMTPEELNYSKALKHQEQSRQIPETDDQDTPRAESDEKVKEHELDAEKTSRSKEKAEKAAARFDFLFQVSSLKDEDSVDTLRADLEAEGMRTRMAKAAEYYIVYVMVRGTQKQADETRARLIELKLGNPLLKQKTAVK